MLGRTGFLPIVCLLSLWGGRLTAHAQADSSLGGKIVHVYLPSDDLDSLILRNWSIPTKKSGKYWYTVTLQGDKYNSSQGFFFATPLSTRFLVRPGLSAQEGPYTNRFTVDDFQGKNEMWIIVDPSGPVTAPPFILLEPPKIINILNPWETTGPRIVFAGGTSKAMVTRADHCGWFMAFLLKPSEMALHFQEIHGMEAYGAGGRGSTSPYDMAALFAAQGVPDTLGTELWLDTETNAWLPAFPDKDGHCQFQLAATVRDFSTLHPDFDFGAITGDFTAPGAVEKTIGADRRPVRSSASSTIGGLNLFNDFASWWRTDSAHATPGLRSYETCVDIPMAKTGDGLWEYDSWRTPERGFYPIDAFNRHAETSSTCAVSPDGVHFTQTGLHNLNFCMESHASFIYRKGQVFEFRGDDDFWVFINDKLVIDLGGVHTPLPAAVSLDTLGLTEGREYKWDMFLCDRQPCTSSLRFKTSLFFKQQKALEAVQDPAHPGAYKIVKREGGRGSCDGHGDSLRVVPAANLTYQLWDATGKVVATLANGSHYNGSLVIASAPPNAEARVTVDTSMAPTTLPPGNYRIVAYDPAQPTVRVQIPFQVRVPTTALRPTAQVRSRSKKPRLHDALGRTEKGPMPRKVYPKP